MSKLRILIIDDEPIICKTMQLMLEEFGYVAQSAECGSKGIELFRTSPYDLVITDLLMPEMSGLEVIEQIRFISPQTPIIVASGVGKSKDAVNAIQRGAWDYIDKPITEIHILKLTIERVLERASLLKEKEEYQKRLEKLILLKTQDLEQTIQELNENKDYLRNILHSISDMIFVTDLSGKVLKINPATSTFLHLQRKDIVNNNIDALFFTDQNSQIISNAIALLKYKESAVIPEMYLTIHEEVFCFRISLTQLDPEDEENHSGVVVVFTDISAYMPGIDQ